jgi:glycosyltransferase involved in cell wall biosynthesis
MTMLSVIILTFNSADSVTRTVTAARQISDDIHVLDSLSTDSTVNICRSLGCIVTQRAFKNYADQRNWAIASLAPKYLWQLHIDADEELEPELIGRLSRLDLATTAYDGFIIGRKVVVFGRTLRFGGIAKTWHCRLFRAGKGHCEDRLYDQHFVCHGPVAVIDAFMLDHQESSLSDWTARHNRWSDLEAQEIAREVRPQDFEIAPRFDGNPIERKRYFKGIYYKMPSFLRAFAYFFYRYIVLLGFLDGKEGMIYHFLQSLWFRFLIDAKIYELRRKRSCQQGKARFGQVDADQHERGQGRQHD